MVLQIMQKTQKAEEVVRERLQVNPTPHMHCLLGELTGDPKHFETSWELSGCAPCVQTQTETHSTPTQTRTDT